MMAFWDHDAVAKLVASRVEYEKKIWQSDNRKHLSEDYAQPNDQYEVKIEQLIQLS
jgi:hypothetical protein